MRGMLSLHRSSVCSQDVNTLTNVKVRYDEAHLPLAAHAHNVDILLWTDSGMLGRAAPWRLSAGIDRSDWT